MTTMMVRPATASNRPAYLDNLYAARDTRQYFTAHSATSSISTNSTASSVDLRSIYHKTRPLTPQLEDDNSDTVSTRSKKSFLSRRNFRLGSLLHRRTYPQLGPLELERPSTSKGTSVPSSPPPAPPSPATPRDIATHQALRRPSLPKLQTTFPPPQAISTYAKRPLPAVPMPKQAKPVVVVVEQKLSSPGTELGCQRCYYYAVRNCQGYVLGGGVGDPCETCLQAGFFGAS